MRDLKDLNERDNSVYRLRQLMPDYKTFTQYK